MAAFFSQDSLQHYLAQHYLLYKDLWSTLYPVDTASTDSSAQHVQHEQLLAYFTQQQIAFRFLDQEHSLLYAEDTLSHSTTSRPFTLCLQFPRLAHMPSSVAFILSLAALSSYRANADLPPLTLQLLFDEAPFSRKKLSEEHRNLPVADITLCDGSGWPDFAPFNVPVFALGCKGQLQVELQVHTAATPLPTAYGAILPNASWRLLWALTSLKDAREGILIEGFYDALHPTDDNDVALLYTYPDTKEYLLQQWQTHSILMNLDSFQQHYAHLLTPTCSITTIHSGLQTEHVLPNSALARVDFQLLPNQTPYDIFSLLRQHLDTHGFQDVQLSPLYTQYPTKLSALAPVTQLIAKALYEVYHQEALLLPFVSGPCPAAAFNQPPTPTVVLPLWSGQYTHYPTEAQFIQAASNLALLFKKITEAN